MLETLSKHRVPFGVRELAPAFGSSTLPSAAACCRSQLQSKKVDGDQALQDTVFGFGSVMK